MNSSKITWNTMHGNANDDWLITYCADGDGIVQVVVTSDRIELLDQLDVCNIWGTDADIGAVLEAAQQYLQSAYPDIYEEAQHHEEKEILAFRSGRDYTEQGQRIAAMQLDNGCIVMLDIDRHIDAMFTDLTPFTQAGIMKDYDNNLTTTPHDAGVSYDAYYSIVNQLRTAAAAL